MGFPFTAYIGEASSISEMFGDPKFNSSPLKKLPSQKEQSLPTIIFQECILPAVDIKGIQRGALK